MTKWNLALAVTMAALGAAWTCPAAAQESDAQAETEEQESVAADPAVQEDQKPR